MAIRNEKIVLSKMWVGVLALIIPATIAWTFQIERRIASIEAHQQNMNNNLLEIKSDISDIRNFIINDISARVTKK